MSCFSSFLQTLIRLTLNDLEMPFLPKSVFFANVTEFVCVDLVDNCVKMNEATPIVSATKMFVMDSSFW